MKTYTHYQKLWHYFNRIFGRESKTTLSLNKAKKVGYDTYEYENGDYYYTNTYGVSILDRDGKELGYSYLEPYKIPGKEYSYMLDTNEYTFPK